MKTMVQSLNAEIKSDSSFMPFLMNVSKTGFTAISIETAVHGADCSALCGRYRFSRIFNIIYFHSNTMKPVICILTGFIIGYGLDSCIIYQTIQSYSFQLIIFAVSLTLLIAALFCEKYSGAI